MNQDACDELLTTTRSVRKRLDFSRPVPQEVIETCLDIAMQAPTGSNRQGWHFICVRDPDRKRGLAELYRKAFMIYSQSDARPNFEGNDPRATQQPLIESSALHLAEHMEDAPLLVVPCVEGAVATAGNLAQASVFGSILPAVWSFMLALRSRGLGAAWTTLHLMYEEDAARMLDIPEGITQAALLPVAYYTGDTFKRAPRIPAHERTYWDRWGSTR